MPVRPLATLSACCALLIALVPAARADSWLPPQPKLAPSEDGRWYVVLHPTADWSTVSFKLVRRAEGAPPRTPPEIKPAGYAQAPRIPIEKGDRVVAHGDAYVPMEVRCLNGGKGFVLFETYANVGHGTVLERRDGKGKVLWSRRLSSFFSENEIRGFTRSVSSIWWYEGLWIDEDRGDIVIVYTPKSGARVLRVGLEDGKHREGTAADVLARLARGHGHERITALQVAVDLKLPGLLTHVQAAYGRPGAPLDARVHLAVYMQAHGDTAGKDVVIAASQPGHPDELRAYALRNVATFLGVEAIPFLEKGLENEDYPVWAASEEGLRKMGAKAVDALIEMILDEKATPRYRRGAVTALWNMQAPAVRALPALERVAKSAPKQVADVAKNAIESLRKLKSDGRPR